MRRIDPREAHIKPLPTPDADSQAYWDALKEGRLLLQHCCACGHKQVYQQALCRQCGAEELVHEQSWARSSTSWAAWRPSR